MAEMQWNPPCSTYDSTGIPCDRSKVEKKTISSAKSSADPWWMKNRGGVVVVRPLREEEDTRFLSRCVRRGADVDDGSDPSESTGSRDDE